MSPSRTSRRHHTDLLVRPPSGVPDSDVGWAALIIDPVAQLAELADLVQRGLLSLEEFERYKARVVESGARTGRTSGGASPDAPPRETE
jgi:hypothetical protein